MKPSHTIRCPDNPDLPEAVLAEMRDIFIRLRDASSLAQMVSVVLTGVRALGRVVLQLRLEQRDLPYRLRSFQVPCPCCKHSMTKSRGKPKRKRRYTILGPIWYRRCQYRCPRCKHRIFPLDESLKLAKALRGHGERFGKTVVLLCTLMPFGKGAELFTKLHGFGVSSQLARALTLTIGLNMVKSEMARAKALWEKRYNDPEFFEPPPAKLRRIKRHRRVYVMMDNSKIGIQEGARGRGAEARNMLRKVALHEKKKAQKKAKRHAKGPKSPPKLSADLESALPDDKDAWRDVRALLIFSEDDLAQTSKTRRQILRRRVVGHVGTKEEWMRLLHMAFHEEGVYTAHEVIFIADGGQGIWELFSELVPTTTQRRVVQILDWFHAVQKLWKVGRAHKGSRTKAQQKACKEWVTPLIDYLAEGKVGNVLQRLRKIKKASDNARTEIDHAIDYFEKHRRRMHYRDFRNRGLLIGSGAIESIHAWVIQPRCRLPGMRWTVKGANAIIRLRCSWASDRWDEDFAQAANGDALSNRNLKVAVGETDP